MINKNINGMHSITEHDHQALKNSRRKRYINQPISLDGEVEEVFKRIVSVNSVSGDLFGKQINYNINYFKDDVNTIKQALSDKDDRIERQSERIKDLNDMLEIDTIAEILDLIKNNKPIPLTRKELLSITTSIEEVVSYDTNTSDFSRGALDEIKIILERLQKWTID